MEEAQISGIPLFADLDKRDRQQIAALAEELAVPAGLMILDEGEPGHHFFAILEGRGDVLQHGERIGTLHEGDFFGEMALLEGDRRSASIRATTPMRLVVLTKDDFWRMDRDMPEVASRLREEVGKRRAWNRLFQAPTEVED